MRCWPSMPTHSRSTFRHNGPSRSCRSKCCARQGCIRPSRLREPRAPLRPSYHISIWTIPCISERNSDVFSRRSLTLPKPRRNVTVSVNSPRRHSLRLIFSPLPKSLCHKARTSVFLIRPLGLEPSTLLCCASFTDIALLLPQGMKSIHTMASPQHHYGLTHTYGYTWKTLPVRKHPGRRDNVTS